MKKTEQSGYEKRLPKIDIEPFSDRVIVVRDDGEEKTPGGIIIPPTVKDEHRPYKGTVIAVGPGRPGDEENRIPLERGDRVMFGKYSGTEHTYLGNTFLIMRMGDIAGKVVIPY